MSIAGDAGPSSSKCVQEIALRREPPYWFEHKTYVKERWIGRTLLEVMVTDFYQRTSAYYQWAILKGYCNINGEKTKHDYRLKSGDKMHNRVHKHEPPVTADPIRVIDRDDEEGRLVIVKPGSIPVHAAGRYNKLTLLELIRKELGIQSIWTSNRLDRLTSGIMVCSTKKDNAHRLSEDFAMGRVRKAYVCRVKGRFPQGEVICKEPLVQCDRQTGISVVHSIGKECETIFNRMSFDAETNTSVVYCRPITGRTHQIRAHVQYLGHPIPNDPIYGHSIWEKYPPQMFKSLPLKADRWKVEPESSLNVYGSHEIDDIVTGLKVDKDEKDDWSRWKDEALFTELLRKEGVEVVQVAGRNGESAAAQRILARPSDEGEVTPAEDEYCQECLVPLTPEVEDEETLYIYLHAIKYQTDAWTFEDKLPWWAQEDWKQHNRSCNVSAPVVSDVKQEKKDAPAVQRELGPAGRDKSLIKETVRLPDVRPILSLKENMATLASTPLEPFQSGVMFEVFGGMEDFAAIDIQQVIQSAMPNEVVGLPEYRLHTSHLIIQPGSTARMAMELWKEGYLNCVHKAYILICSERIPSEMLVMLEKERKVEVARQEGINHSKRARIRAKKAGIETVEKVADVVDGAKTRSETEEALLQLLQDAWDRENDAREFAMREWKLTTGKVNEPTMEEKIRYRGRVDRSGFSLPTLKTTDMERIVGSLTWHWLNGKGVEEGPWSVDLVEPDLDVVVKMLPGWSTDTDVDPHWRTKMGNIASSFFYLFRIRQQEKPTHRSSLPVDLIAGGTALARYRSYTLAVALPIVETDDKPLIIWEPCVGTGSIAIEMDATLSKRSCQYQIFASDLFGEEIEKARQICALCKTSSHIKLAQIDGTDLTASISFLGGTNVLDGIVTDLPWGRRVLNHMTISLLYPSLLKVWVEVLKPGGAVVAMTAENKTFLRALKAHEADMRKRDTGWILALEKVQTSGIRGNAPANMLSEEHKLTKMRTVACGYDVSVFILRKRSLEE